MIDLFVLWEKFTSGVNTHQGGHARPHREFTSWVNDISKEIFEEKFKNGWQKSQKITDDIGQPFLKSEPLPLTAGSVTYDLLAYPSDYGHFSSCRIFHKEGSNAGEKVECSKRDSPDVAEEHYYENQDENLCEKTIDLIDNRRWGALCEHKTKKPSFEKPYMTQTNGGFKISPKGVGYVVLDYLRLPKEATFSYTVGPDDQIIYNQAGSQPLEWSELLIPEFLARLSTKYGKRIRNEFVYQAGSKEKADL
jgi:hypothetical protein